MATTSSAKEDQTVKTEQEWDGGSMSIGRPKPPDRGPFSHSDECQLAKHNPGFEPEWQYEGQNRWIRSCQCWEEVAYVSEPKEPIDPYDIKVARHGPACRLKDETDLELLKDLLVVREGSTSDYFWIHCPICQYSWASPDILRLTASE
jgi:hypothetical protein